MASYVVSLTEEVDFAPQGVVQEVLQNVRTILSTRKGTVPLDRDFGLDWSFIDAPTPMAMMQAREEIIDALERYEPRAVVESIEFDQTADAKEGLLRPKVKVSIEETQ